MTIKNLKIWLLESYQFVSTNLVIFIIIIFFGLKLKIFNESHDLISETLTLALLPFLISTIFFVFILNLKKRNVIAFCLNLTLSLIIFADVIYIKYFGSLPSVQTLFFIDQTGDVVSGVLRLFSFTDLIYLIDIPFLTAFVYLNNRSKKELPKNFRTLKYFAIIPLLLLLLSLIMKEVPELKKLYSKAYDSFLIAERYSVLGYHSMDIVKYVSGTFKKIELTERKNIISNAKNNKKEMQQNEKTATSKGKTVILLQVESLQGWVLNKEVNGQEITPNLNKLLKESDYFSNHYFQLGPGSTSDTDFSANTSIYPLRDAATFVQYGKNELSGVATVAKNNGYSTSAYHAYKRSFWNRNVALKSMGYERFFAEESYPKGEQVVMGLNDSDFLKKTASLIKDSKKPSFNYAITLSSHYPFYLSDEMKGLDITTKDYTEGVNNYYHSINYTDRAIGEFLDYLKREDLYEDSLILVYGDHHANVGDLEDPQTLRSLGLNKDKLSKKESLELKKIPLIIHHPNQHIAQEYNEVTSNIDITPTLLNLLGFKSNLPMFGRDLYGKEEPYFASVMYFGSGVIMDKEKIYFDPSVEEKEGGCFLLGKADLVPTDQKNCEELIKRRDLEFQISEKLIKYDLLKSF